MRKLDAKERRFVEEYLIDLDPNRAALSAGYSKTTAASKAYQWVSNSKVKPHVLAAVQAGQAARSERTEITQDMVLRELAKIGFSDIRKIVRWGNTELQVSADEEGNQVTQAYHGLALVGADAVDDDTAAAIAEISEGREGLKIKLHDKKGALVDIGRHLGMFPNKVEVAGANGGPIQNVSMTLGEFESKAREVAQKV